jgi:hypothetical protein
MRDMMNALNSSPIPLNKKTIGGAMQIFYLPDAQKPRDITIGAACKSAVKLTSMFELDIHSIVNS